MPTLMWLYLTALLYDRTSATCVALAEAWQTVSHDRLTRWWQADWSGHTLLERACRPLFVWQRGDLIMDDTVIPNPVAAAIEGLAWVFSSRERRPVSGLPLVLLVWTDGTCRVPWGLRLWRIGHRRPRHARGLGRFRIGLAHDEYVYSRKLLDA